MSKTATAARSERVPVTERALIQRVNRKLAASGQLLKKTRGEAAEETIGAYYVLDTRRNTVVLSRVNLVALAQKLGVLQKWETVS
jgi:hypothetical protein